MPRLSTVISALAALVPYALGQQQAEFGQCGGIGWTGPTTCVSGTTCTTFSAYYSQCLAANVDVAATTSAAPASSAASAATSTSSTTTAASSVGLNALAQAAGKLYLGSATDNPELTDTPYVTLLSDQTQFGQLTAGNSMKWDATEPNPGQFTFDAGDAIANLAKQNDQLLRGHNCVWHSQLPSWVENGQFTAAELTSVVQSHCSTLVGHYKGQVVAVSTMGFYADNIQLEDSWDVVNEPFNDDGTLRTDVFGTTLGTSYITAALQAARSADPDAKLYINDFNIEQTGAKATAMLNLAKQLLADNVPLDGIGFQSHFIVGEVPSSFQTVMEQFTALGLEVAITELDIRMTLPSTDALLAQQQTDYQNVVQMCMNVEGCVGVTLWDYTDKFSWVPSTFPGQGAACPFDENLQIKPAYNGIVAALSPS